MNRSILFYSILHSVTPFTSSPEGTSPQSHLWCHNGCKHLGTPCIEQQDVTQTFLSPSHSSLLRVPLDQLSTARIRWDPSQRRACRR